MKQQQIGSMYSNTCIGFIQQQELIHKYNRYKSQRCKQIYTDTYKLKHFLNAPIVDMNMK